MKYLFLVFLLFSSTYIFSQSLKIGSLISEFNRNGEIEGFIYDGENDKEPLFFAEIIVKDTNIKATTNIDGSFKLNLKPGKYSIIFSFIGYKTVEVNNIEIASNDSIKLKQVLKALKIDTDVSEVNLISKVK